MKNLITSTLIILFTSLVIAAVPTDAELKIYDDTLRLHILANSDEASDQVLKLQIRDRLLTKYGNILKGVGGVTEAEGKIASHISEIEKDVEEWTRELGYGYDARVSLDVEWYGTREYESFTLPKGYYSSLKVEIGEGKGKNWWCVMYPPLCMEIATEYTLPQNSSGYSNEELYLIQSGEYNIKFKILEILSEAFAKNG